MTPSLPKSVKVGYRVYRVEGWPHNEARASARWGETDRMNFVIRVQVDGLPPRQVAETLLHEILHCVYGVWPIYEKHDEEEIVVAMSAGLATVMVDNPEVFAWIAEALHA